MVNVERLQKALDHITEHPEAWDQDSWGSVFDDSDENVVKQYESQDGDAPADERTVWNACVSAGCVAGHVCLQNGYLFITSPWSNATSSVINVNDLEDPEITEPEAFSIEQLAAELLGLMPSEADWLFKATNELIDLWCIAFHLTAGEIQLPDGLPEMNWDIARYASREKILKTIARRNKYINGSEFTISFMTT